MNTTANDVPVDCGLCRDLKWIRSPYIDDPLVTMRCAATDVTGLVRVNALGQVETPAWCPLRRVPA